jgi:predicted dehydrogenase
MMMSVEECDDVINEAKSRNLILNVNHSFSLSNGFVKLRQSVETGKLGEIQSIVEIQLSNRDRRLPKWYNDLPLGLFYDEAAHFFYSAMLIGGELEILNAHAQYGEIKENTPRHLEVQAKAGEIPVQMYMNFNSPVCEWNLLLLGTKKIAIYDYFKDILIFADNDKLHLAGNILKTSLSYTFGFWKGFIVNGVRLVSKRLLYGHDKVIAEFVNSIIANKDTAPSTSAELGRNVIKAMNKVVMLTAVQVENPVIIREDN